MACDHTSYGIDISDNKFVKAGLENHSVVHPSYTGQDFLNYVILLKNVWRDLIHIYTGWVMPFC